MKLVEKDNSRQRLVADAGETVVHLQNSKTTERPRHRPPEAVVIHYTAVQSPTRPPAQLNQFRALLGEELAQVEAFVSKRGVIPSALLLSLANASNRERQASWDITVGKDGLVVQCNLQPTTRATWHAGRTLADYIEARGGRDLRDRRGRLVYDGTKRTFVSPVLPISGQVMQSGNSFTIGIEVENWGRVTRLNGVIGRIDGKRFSPIPNLKSDDLIQVEGKLYDRVTEPQYRALIAVCRAYRDFYQLPDNAWFGHHEIVPDRRSDPDPPIDLTQLVQDIYADELEVVEAHDSADFEAQFVAAPVLNNNSVDAG